MESVLARCLARLGTCALAASSLLLAPQATPALAHTSDSDLLPEDRPAEPAPATATRSAAHGSIRTHSSGPDLAIVGTHPIEPGAPGETRTLPFTVTNDGNESAPGFTLRLIASHGLREMTRYDACTYTHTGGEEYAPTTHAECSFHQPLAPGDSFTLPEPLTVRFAPHALRERFDIEVEPLGGLSDPNPEDNYVVQEIDAAGTADFAVTGDTVSAAAGEVVTARLTFHNHGPAWVGNLGSGDPAAWVSLLVPEGTTVTGVPADCTPRTRSGGYYPERHGAPRYDCALPYWVSENAQRAFDLTVRIDSVIPGATGDVRVRPQYGEFAFDPDLSNNTARVTVN